MKGGIQIIRPSELSGATAQTSGMQRMAAIAGNTTGSEHLWLGLVKTPVGTASGWHHHGNCESGIYVVSGRARFTWSSGGISSAEVGPGDFLAVPPNVIHKENCIGDEPCVMVVARGCKDSVVVNVDAPNESESSS